MFRFGFNFWFYPNFITMSSNLSTKYAMEYSRYQQQHCLAVDGFYLSITLTSFHARYKYNMIKIINSPGVSLNVPSEAIISPYALTIGSCLYGLLSAPEQPLSKSDSNMVII
jgi:hypothetical protein